mgnify:CR=1 FL=1
MKTPRKSKEICKLSANYHKTSILQVYYCKQQQGGPSPHNMARPLIGPPTYLINMMRKYDVLPTGITRVEADESEFDAPTEDMTTLMPLLYQSGYLTIKDYNRDYNYYTLDIPNKEVKIGLTKIFNFDSSKGNIEDWVIE